MSRSHDTVMNGLPWTKTCSTDSGQTSVPLPSFKSLRCLRCGIIVSGTDEEKRSELMKGADS